MRKHFYYKDGMIFNRETRSSGAVKDEEAGSVKNNGYRVVAFGGKQLRTHRIVYAIHHGAIPEGMDVDHIDNNRLNNKIENLQLLTRTDNVLKGMREGKHNNPETPIIGVCVTTGKVVEFVSQMDAHRSGFTQGNVSKCLLGKRPTCKGYRWSYANKEIAA